jgi:acyl-CoA dehydrogenase
MVFPIGQRFSKPSDELERQIADLITHDTPTRQRLIDGIFASESDYHPVHALNEALVMADEVASLEKKMRKAIKSGGLPSFLGLELIEAAAKAGVLDKAEAKLMRDYDEKIMNIIHVDEFDYDAFSRPSAIKKTSKPGKKKVSKKAKVTETID